MTVHDVPLSPVLIGMVNLSCYVAYSIGQEFLQE